MNAKSEYLPTTGFAGRFAIDSAPGLINTLQHQVRIPPPNFTRLSSTSPARAGRFCPASPAGVRRRCCTVRFDLKQTASAIFCTGAGSAGSFNVQHYCVGGVTGGFVKVSILLHHAPLPQAKILEFRVMRPVMKWPKWAVTFTFHPAPQ